MKILIGIPCASNSMHTLTAQSVFSLCKSKKHDFDVHFVNCSVVHIAREELVKVALAGNYDALLFVDSDMVFSNLDVYKLIDADKDLISSVAVTRNEPHMPCVYKKMRIGLAGEKEEEKLTEFDGTVKECEGFGLACALIKTDVLRAMIKHNSSLFWPVFGYGEDLSFCIKARKEGYKLYCHTGSAIGHIGEQVFTLNDFRGAK